MKSNSTRLASDCIVHDTVHYIAVSLTPMPCINTHVNNYCNRTGYIIIFYFILNNHTIYTVLLRVLYLAINMNKEKICILARP